MGISAMPLSSCYLKPPARGGLILGYGGTDAQADPRRHAQAEDAHLNSSLSPTPGDSPFFRLASPKSLPPQSDTPFKHRLKPSYSRRTVLSSSTRVPRNIAIHTRAGKLGTSTISCGAILAHARRCLCIYSIRRLPQPRTREFHLGFRRINCGRAFRILSRASPCYRMSPSVRKLSIGRRR